MIDYKVVNGKRSQREEKPKSKRDVQIGVPDIQMETCDRIMTKNGPVYRGGGLYILEDDVLQLGILIEVYKAPVGPCYAVIQKLEDVSFEKDDPFLNEAGIKVWKKKQDFILTSSLLKIESAPLLHACSAEVPPTIKCMFVTGLTDVREERQMVQQRKERYRCLGKNGNFFILSATCFSLPIGVGVGCC